MCELEARQLHQSLALHSSTVHGEFANARAMLRIHVRRQWNPISFANRCLEFVLRFSISFPFRFSMHSLRAIINNKKINLLIPRRPCANVFACIVFYGDADDGAYYEKSAGCHECRARAHTRLPMYHPQQHTTCKTPPQVFIYSLFVATNRAT